MRNRCWLNVTGHSLCSKQGIPCVRSRTFLVFEAEHSLCSKQNIPCIRSRTFLVLEAEHSLCSKQDIPCVRSKTFLVCIWSSNHHMIIWSYNHIIISANQKSASQFWPESQEKNRNRFFYPSTKNHRELIFWTSGVIFRDESHGNAQKITAPPNRHFTCSVTTFEILQNLQTVQKSRG